MNQSGVSLRQLTQLIGRLSSAAIAILPAPLQYRALQRQQIRGEREFSCMHSPVRCSESRNSVVDRKFDVAQGESNNISTSLTSYNFGRLHARVGGSLSKTNNRESVDTRGTEKSFKHIRAEGNSVGNFDVHLYASTSTFKKFANRQDDGYFLYSENGEGGGGWGGGGGGGTHNKVLSHITKEIWDYLLSKGITITVEHLPADLQSRLKGDSSEWKLKPNVFQALCKREWTTDIDLFALRASNQVPCYYSWKLDPFSKGRDAFQMS